MCVQQMHPRASYGASAEMSKIAPVLQDMAISEFGDGAEGGGYCGLVGRLAVSFPFLCRLPSPSLPPVLSLEWSQCSGDGPSLAMVEKAWVLELGRRGFEFQHPT